LIGGYTGPGSKSAIPAKATAKIGFRLVPNQDPEEIQHRFEAFVRQMLPADERWRLRSFSKTKPVRLSLSQPVLRAVRHACRQGFGREPLLIPSGGTISVVRAFEDLLRVPTLLLGFSLAEDRLHAPNERFSVRRLCQGTRTMRALLRELSRVSTARDFNRVET